MNQTWEEWSLGDTYSKFLRESLNCDGQQFHQYHQNEQSFNL